MKPFQPGDRIELIVMTDDPNPVPPGTKGTVESCERVDCGHRSFWQVEVDWDNGRSLSLCIGPDSARLIPS